MCELLTGSLPFENKSDPMEIHKQIIQGEIKYQRDLVDPTARNLLQQIFVTEPNLRITLDGMKKHRYF